MFEMIIHFILLYFFIRNTRLDKNNWIKRFALLFLISSLSIELYFELPWYYSLLIVFLEVTLYMVYLIFYDNDVFTYQIKWFIPIIGCFVALHFTQLNEWLVVGFTLLCFGLTKKNQYKLSLKSYIFFVILIGISLYMKPYYLVIISIVALDIYGLLFDVQNTKNLNQLQNRLLTQQYDEIKHVYLNMRGWRHDYHNHIQAMKAYISMEAFNELGDYLNDLEQSLKEVDQLVKSGHLMMDAILNSKITIMLKDNIHVDFKAMLPESLDIEDVDLCVMVSNLLENAIEACRSLDKEERFIRIFSEVYGSQFYLSIQNSAEEDLTFNQKNYISSKRGDHGLGMKRVAFLTKKYGGYLNLQNEPGVFASEITIPLK